jgi:hypothetical protein
MTAPMPRGLADVSDTALERLRLGLETGRLRAPLTRASLIAYGVKGQLDALVATLEGHSRDACLSIVTAVLAERAKFDRPAPELVWTGPEGGNAAARDTAVVLRELFEASQERVVLAGYSFLNATAVLGPLHVAMKTRAVEALFFIDIPQLERSVPDPESHGQAALAAFVEASWPFGAPFPEVYCDRRALRPGPPWSSLHAKCVAVDGRRAFVSSANFTTRGQDRNIETGVLIDDTTFAGQLERQWLGLIESRLLLKWRRT